jgi:hypothetical protein
MKRMLKPYQLVGVNFMLLLHRKHVGGGKVYSIQLLRLASGCTIAHWALCSNACFY